MKARTLIASLMSGIAISSANAEPGSESSNRGNGWLFPGEYESHQAMWMLWPTFENKAGFPSTEVTADMIRAMHGHVHVNLAVQDADDEAAATWQLTSDGVPLDHVHFFHIEHGDLWARDTGAQFTRNRSGKLRVIDWSFNMWGNEEPDSDNSTFDEPQDRTIAAAINVPVASTRPGPTGVRMISEGGGVSHNGRGTMIAVESVAIQRNLGPGRFCGSKAPITDFSQPNTYAPNPDWPLCRLRMEFEYRRLMGVQKVIWIPTGVIEDSGTFRGALGKHIHIPEFDGVRIPHAGVYTVFATNGHVDDFIRFVAPDKVVLAQETVPTTPARTPVERLMRYLQEQNYARLERAYDVISKATTESGQPIQVVRIPVPKPIFEVFKPGDGIYDYYAAYERWEDGSTLPEFMLGVWASSYVNYVPTNDLVLVSRFWKPGRPEEIDRRDYDARNVLEDLFPGRKIVQIYSENVNRGGGGMNCITQQQPASAKFAQKCGGAKVQVAARFATLYAGPIGGNAVGIVPRLMTSDGDLYLKRLASFNKRVRVQVVGKSKLDGKVGWVDEEDIESAGEKCAAVYSLN